MVQLSFASLNLENLHLPGEPIYGRPGLTSAQFDAKVSWTAQVVRELDADVIGFQELWHPDALAAVFEHTGLDAYHVWAPPSAGRIGNAIAVRTPHQLESIEWIERFPDRFLLRAGSEDATGIDPALSAAGTDYTLSVTARDFSRPLLHATIKTHQGRRRPRVDLYVAHLKSKAPTRLRPSDAPGLSSSDRQALGSALSHVRRTAEAAALRMVLNDVMDGDTPVVVLGDLNDAQRAVTNEIISGPHAYRLFQRSRAGSRAKYGLYDAATMQQLRSRRDVYFTYLHDGAHESLDHILVSQHFYDYATRRLWSFRQLRTLNDALDTLQPDGPTSDHAPIVATFELDPA